MLLVRITRQELITRKLVQLVSYAIPFADVAVWTLLNRKIMLQSSVARQVACAFFWGCEVRGVNMTFIPSSFVVHLKYLSFRAASLEGRLFQISLIERTQRLLVPLAADIPNVVVACPFNDKELFRRMRGIKELPGVTNLDEGIKCPMNK